MSIQLINKPDSTNNALIQSKPQLKRTSKLAAPIIQLTGGHEEKEIFCGQFNANGTMIASGGFDKNIALWNVYGEINNQGKLIGHKGAVLELQWDEQNNRLFSASSDKTIGMFDLTTGAMLKRFKGHTAVVNSIDNLSKFSEAGIIASVSDDRTLKVWDPRFKNTIIDLDLQFPLTSVKFSKNGDALFIASLDESIKCFDLRSKTIQYELLGHEEAVTGLTLSNDGNSLASFAMDNTLRVWDIKPFSILEDRSSIIYEGVPHGFEKNLIKPSFSKEDDLLATGCGDRSVMIFNLKKNKLEFKLPGHNGTVNQVHFSPVENIILSVSSDSSLFVGEI